MRGSRAQCPARPRAHGGDDPTEAIDLRFVGTAERANIYWGNHFWAKGYCVDSVGLDADMIRKYVRYQEKKEKLQEQLQLSD